MPNCSKNGATSEVEDLLCLQLSYPEKDTRILKNLLFVYVTDITISDIATMQLSMTIVSTVNYSNIENKMNRSS